MFKRILITAAITGLIAVALSVGASAQAGTAGQMTAGMLRKPIFPTIGRCGGPSGKNARRLTKAEPRQDLVLPRRSS